MMKSRFSRFLLRSQGAAISEAELIHFFLAQRFGAIGAGPATSLGAGPFVVEQAIIKKGNIMTVEVSRRSILIGGMAVLATALPVPAMALRLHALDSNSDKLNEGEKSMATITTKDGTQIFYKDWGPKDAQPIVFHHGWPLSSDDWDTQMLFFLANGYRVVAHDRRGHGRSSQVGTGHDMDHYASDASAVAEHLDLKNAIHVGHSTGGGEVARYVAKYGEPQRRVAKAVLISAVPPLMVKTEKNPGGTPIEVFDGFRKALADNRAQFYIDVPSGPFYGFNRTGAKVSQGVIQNWWRQGMMGGALAQYEGIKAFSETDQTDDLKAITVPTLVMQGDDDQIVPYKDASLLQAKLLKHGTLKIYPGFPHGMMTTHADVINADLLAFIRS
jgi:non-heme chloroperoxidase